ncbi:MAG TPA: PQQ-binding-like beta-propeller repeat protein [Pyrinomonadaceae bacterium]|nr:PQQ-binding-like beta-propeller repeat protein [Pyrinomonadaceae bacterium]
MKTALCMVSALLFCVLPVRAQDDVGSIRNFLRVNDQFCTGGQPRIEHLAKLKSEGVKAIINLRRPTEHRADEEEAKAKELGLRYFNIPVAFGDPKEEQATEFLKLTDDPANRPAFVHCTAAIRVGAFWLIRRVMRDGWKFEDALAEAEKVGLREAPHLVDFARNYIQKYQKAAAAQTASAAQNIPVVQKSSSTSTTAGMPSDPMSFGAFTVRFDPGGTFTLEGAGWPKLNGNWKKMGSEVELAMSGGPGGCNGPGTYGTTINGTHLTFDLVKDDCTVRRMILDRSTWRPASEALIKPVRAIKLTAGARLSPKAKPLAAGGSWPSFRGPNASGIAEGQNLPDKWDAKTGENILWRTPIPGLAHSSPVVWGNRIFVTSAISSDAKATFKPGLYGDGDASKDRSEHRWMLYALDKQTGKVVWERVAFKGEPREKRHIKATYANSTPATDGRIVVAWFGSQGLYTYDMNGRLLWKVDLGRMDAGAYDLPTYEWGTASSPIIWHDLVILQCDTQSDSFIIALDAKNGKTVWKTDRDELPSWGSPTVVTTSKGEELVTNASNFIRGYDPRTGKELWRLGRSSKITAPTPIFADDVLVVASGRGPERPIFVLKPGARGDITLPEGKTSSDAVIWSRTGRGSYMPTPLIYNGILYVLANNGTFDAYNLKTGDELYRQRLPVIGSGFSASPVAADGKIYLSNEDGEIVVVSAGEKFSHIATNTMGELLMATPALSDGVMYVRSAESVIAVGKKK